MNVVVGTAGHVDHGKTMLIKALTGIDTDRLQEEKKRGISIDLGFAPLYLPSGRLAGVVDVPGHEKFIHNMLAGAGGIDLVVLVIDATEGVMPQTREHLDILRLLQVDKGLVALTKVDLVEDEWLELVEEEIMEELEGTFLEEAPLFKTSVVTGEGIEGLKQAIDDMTRDIKGKSSSAPLRLPLDRIFLKAGFGLVITGTLLSGKLNNNDVVEVLPPGVESRVRGIQVHGKEVDKAEAGQRVALNLSGVEKEEFERGAVVVDPGFFNTTRYLDVKLKLLATSPFSLKHSAPVHFYLGTARTVGKVSLLNREELKAGEEDYCQFRLEKEIVAQRGDNFIIRSYSPMVTIGGGIVLDDNPPRHKRFRPQVIEHFSRLENSREEFLYYKLEVSKWLNLNGLKKLAKASEEEVTAAMKKLQQENRVVYKDSFFVASSTWKSWKKIIVNLLGEYHQSCPLLPGFPRARCKGHLPAGLPSRLLDKLLAELAEEGIIEAQEDMIKLTDFKPEPNKEEEKLMEKIILRLESKGFSPPSFKEMAGETGLSHPKLEELLQFLLNRGDLVKISEDIFFEKGIYKKALQVLVDHFENSEKITLAHYRDLTGSSRRVAQGLLEHFDGKGYTRRVGDERVPWKISSVS